MVNKAKRKGTRWENEAVTILTNMIKGSSWKRIPGSGAIGTIMNEALLTGDLTGVVPGLPMKVKAECKAGYARSTEAKTFSIEKKWLDKIREEAENNYSLPILFGKFDNVHSGIRHFAVLDFSTLAELLNYIGDLKKELDILYTKKEIKSES